jgi:hypothetical protein
VPGIFLLVALAFGFGGAGVGSGRALFLYGPQRRRVGGVFQQLATYQTSTHFF